MSDPAIIPDERKGLASASRMDRLYRCPGSFAAERDASDLPSEQVTQDGTDIHEAIHSGDDSELQMTQREITAKLREMEVGCLERWIAEFNIPPASIQTIRETRYWILDGEKEIASAKPDVVFVSESEGRAQILNFKSGYAALTPSELSWQSRCEVIAYWNNHRDATHIRAGFIASRIHSRIDTTDYEVSDLVRIKNEIRTIVWRAEQGFAPRTPGAHCRYCKAHATCPEAAAYALLPVIYSGPGALPLDRKADPILIIQAIGRLTPQQMGFLYRRKPLVETIFKTLGYRLKSLPAADLEAAGYLLAPGNNNKEVTDPALAYSRLKSVLTDSERVQVIKLLRGTAAKMLAERTEISVKSAQVQIDEALGDCLVDKPGQPKLKAL